MQSTQNWEVDFEELTKYGDTTNTTVERSKLKSFIRSVEEKAREEGYQAGIKYQRMSNLIHKKSILERIKNLSDYSQQEEWRDCKKQLEMLNLSDPNNKETFEEAKKKGL